MSPLALIVGALVVALVIGFGVTIGAPIFALPFVAVALGVIALAFVKRRNRAAQDMKRFREQARAEKVEFTPRDRESQARERPLR